MLQLLIVLLVIEASITGSRAECNACASITNVACISDTQFQFCKNNSPNGPINSCPTGSYCTSQIPICQENASLNACEDCGKCNSDLSFACTGSRTFALCLGSSMPSNYTGICSSDYVCNVNVPQICGKITETSATCPWNRDTTTPEPTTDSTSEITTTERTSISAKGVCRNANSDRSFHAFPNDTECTSYVYCKFLLITWVGHIIHCPKSNPYFSAATHSCGKNKPTQPGCL